MGEKFRKVKFILENWSYTLNRIEAQEEYIKLLRENAQVAALKAQDVRKDSIQGGGSSSASYEGLILEIDEREAKLKLDRWEVEQINKAVHNLEDQRMKDIIRMIHFERKKKGAVAGLMFMDRTTCWKIRTEAIGLIAFQVWGES